MKRTIKSFIARWIARRIETRNRQLRRALRDQHRVVMARVEKGDNRALGLRLYAAWSNPRKAQEVGRPSMLWSPSSVQQSLPDLRIHQLADYNA